jgi:hypothetical protein
MRSTIRSAQVALGEAVDGFAAFLIDYGRLLALACARAPRLELMERFAGLAQSILGTEMDLHRSYAAEWGISREELEQQEAHAATRAYTDFLLRTATLGDFGELVAALLPCMWGYNHDEPQTREERQVVWPSSVGSGAPANVGDVLMGGVWIGSD